MHAVVLVSINLHIKFQVSMRKRMQKTWLGVRSEMWRRNTPAKGKAWEGCKPSLKYFFNLK